MNMDIEEILRKEFLEKEDIVRLLGAQGEEMKQLIRKALEVKLERLDNRVHLRGLIELSNVCRKSCLYCGVRRDNGKVERYTLTEDEVVECARLAKQLNYGSVAIQSGERNDPEFVAMITRIIHRIKEIDNGSLGITLSLGRARRLTAAGSRPGRTATCCASSRRTRNSTTASIPATSVTTSAAVSTASTRCSISATRPAPA